MKLPDTLTTNERLFLRKWDSSYTLFCKAKGLEKNHDSAKGFISNKRLEFNRMERFLNNRLWHIKFTEDIRKALKVLQDASAIHNRMTETKLKEAYYFFKQYTEQVLGKEIVLDLEDIDSELVYWLNGLINTSIRISYFAWHPRLADEGEFYYAQDRLMKLINTDVELTPSKVFEMLENSRREQRIVEDSVNPLRY